MIKTTFYTDDEDRDYIAIKSEYNWGKTQIFYNNEEIDTIQNKKELFKGKHYQVTEEKVLTIRLIKAFNQVLLELRINNIIIKDCPADPEFRLKKTTWLVRTFSAILITLGAVNAFAYKDLVNTSRVIETIAIGLVILGLSFGVERKSKVALWIIVGLLILETLAWLILFTLEGRSISYGFVIKIILALHLSKGFSAISQIRRQEAQIPKDFKEV